MNAINPKRAVERCERLSRLGSPPPWWSVFAMRRWLQQYRAITTTDISQLSEMLREVYSTEQLMAQATRPNPLAGLMRKS